VPGDRRGPLPGRAVQRLVHGHRDRRRNLADTDRYNLLPALADRLGLDTTDDRSLWRDRALVELNVAVLHSFDTAGVTITDHHTQSDRFLTHLAQEKRAGRCGPADWSWIMPPMSGSATGVFHRYYDEVELSPAYVLHDDAVARARGSGPAAEGGALPGGHRY